MSSGFFHPLINHYWWAVCNFEFRKTTAEPPSILYQEDPDSDGPYLIGLYMDIVRYSVFIWIVREHKTEWLGL